MTKRNFWIRGASAAATIVAALMLNATQAHAVATSTPTLPPMEMHVPVHPELVQCPSGSGITVTPTGVPSFTAQSIAFERGDVLSVSTASRPGGRVKIVKLSDSASPSLSHAAQRLTMFPTVTIVMHKSQGVPADTIVTLSSATVVGFDTQRTPTATTATQETVTFAYQKLTHSSCGI